jgi:putative oxidoreductase
MTAADVACVLLRTVVGATMAVHGFRHAFGEGKLPGTARWFESIGVRPGRLNALAATATELGAGALLVVGLLTPLAAAGVVGTMFVALVANHFKNGFFIFNPGEGYEYVLLLIVCGVSLTGLGAGQISVDHAIGLDWRGWSGLATAGVAGFGGAGLVLACCWRPSARSH